MTQHETNAKKKRGNEQKKEGVVNRGGRLTTMTRGQLNELLSSMQSQTSQVAGARGQSHARALTSLGGGN
jgi:hypothetical protein